jgi:membrane fusion protein, heavy metal efflux system
MTISSRPLQRTLLSMLLGTSVLMLPACGDKAPTTPAAASAEADPLSVVIKPEMATQFKVSPLQMQEITPWLEISGRIEANDRSVTRIGAAVTGRVTEVLAEVGDRVQRGQALARVASA